MKLKYKLVYRSSQSEANSIIPNLLTSISVECTRPLQISGRFSIIGRLN